MIGNNINIHFLTASDRINYGDLLFPLITKEILKRAGITMINYGLIKSDLSHFGALPTESYKKLQKNLKREKFGIIVIGGGEVFFPSWTLLYSYINRNFASLLKYKRFRKIESKFKISKNLLSDGTIEIPFAFGIHNFKTLRTKIIYNAVGGALNLIEGPIKQKTIKNLKTVTYLSVRDVFTFKSLVNEGISAKLAPDSAVIISDLYNKNNLFDICSRFREILETPYLFFQLAEQYAPKDFDRLTDELVLIGKKLSLKVILCPIGLASGHNDHIILKNIASLSSHFKYIQPKNLFEIMGLIAHSKLYLGTSLHGAITAQTYHVPFLPLYNIPKVNRFYQTWHDHLPPFNFDINNLHGIVSYVKNWDYERIENNNRYQKRLVYQNFAAIVDKIRE